VAPWDRATAASRSRAWRGGEHGQVGGDAGGQRQLGEHVHDHGLDRLGAEDAVESAAQLVDGLVKPGVGAGEGEVFEVATARRAPSRDGDDDRRGVGREGVHGMVRYWPAERVLIGSRPREAGCVGGGEQAPAQPQRHLHQADEHGRFDQRPGDPDQGGGRGGGRGRGRWERRTRSLQRSSGLLEHEQRRCALAPVRTVGRRDGRSRAAHAVLRCWVSAWGAYDGSGLEPVPRRQPRSAPGARREPTAAAAAVWLLVRVPQNSQRRTRLAARAGPAIPGGWPARWFTQVCSRQIAAPQPWHTATAGRACWHRVAQSRQFMTGRPVWAGGLPARSAWSVWSSVRTGAGAATATHTPARRAPAPRSVARRPRPAPGRR